MPRKPIAAAALAALPLAVSAQDSVLVSPSLGLAFSGTHLVVGLVAGVLLAVAFELVLTNLSLAGGLSALAMRREGAAGEDKERRPLLRRLTTGLGLWMLVTTSLATFAASWLAVEISGAANAFTGVIIGLMVWAAFLVLMAWWEALAMRSLLGLGYRLARGGLSTLARAGRGLMPGARADGRRLARAMRRELLDLDDAEDVREWLERLVDRARTPQLDYARIRREIERILVETGVATAALEGQAGESDLAQLAPSAAPGSGGLRATLGRLVHEALEALKTPAPTVSRWAGGTFESGWMRYLANARREELDPEAIRRELELLARDPKAGVRALAERLSHLDRDSVAALLAQRQDLDAEEARRVVERVLAAKDELLGQAHAARGSVRERLSGARERIRAYLDGLGRPELDYDGLVAEFRQLFSEPRVGFEHLRERFRRIDRGTILAVLASREGVSEEDAERMLARFERARDEAWTRFEHARERVSSGFGVARDAAIGARAQARSCAAATAWWMVGAATVSGLCAAIAGAIAVNV